jgi:hypothetical protein
MRDLAEQIAAIRCLLHETVLIQGWRSPDLPWRFGMRREAGRPEIHE